MVNLWEITLSLQSVFSADNILTPLWEASTTGTVQTLSPFFLANKNIFLADFYICPAKQEKPTL